MLTIQLKDLEMHAHHGVYAEERILGGKYLVNVEVVYKPEVDVVTELYQTLNYETLFEIVYTRMMQPTPLLEQIVMEATLQVLENFPQTVQVSMRIEKCNPPIEKLKGSVQVSYTRNRN